MYEAGSDAARNLLTIRYNGAIGLEEAIACADEVQRLVSQLSPGFSVLTDLTDLESMDFACVPEIQRMMDICNQRQVKLVVRIIPDPHKDVGLNIMSLFHYGRGVRIVTCDSLSEAQRAVGT